MTIFINIKISLWYLVVINEQLHLLHRLEEPSLGDKIEAELPEVDVVHLSSDVDAHERHLGLEADVGENVSKVIINLITNAKKISCNS